MTIEKRFNSARSVIAFNTVTIGWVLIKIFIQYKEMIWPISSYLLALLISHVALLCLLTVGLKKPPNAEKNG